MQMLISSRNPWRKASNVIQPVVPGDGIVLNERTLTDWMGLYYGDKVFWGLGYDPVVLQWTQGPLLFWPIDGTGIRILDSAITNYMQLYHDTTNAYININSGSLIIPSGNFTLGLNGVGGHEGILSLRDGLNPGSSATLSFTKWNDLESVNGLIKCNGSGNYSSIADNSTNWNTAYGWGNHATAGYAPSSQGVTNGNTHDHVGGDGAQIDHTGLSNIGTNTHAQIDTHIAASNPHSGSAPLASPTFTGVPAAPTAAAGTNTTQLATTAFVQSAGKFVDRGDPNAWDKNSSFTVGAWTNWDISSIVPAGASGISLIVQCKNTTVGEYFAFRKDGNVNTYNIPLVYIMVANVVHNFTITIPCSTSRVIEYFLSNSGGGWSSLALLISGYYI